MARLWFLCAIFALPLCGAAHALVFKLREIDRPKHLNADAGIAERMPLELFSPYKEANAELGEEGGCVLFDVQPTGGNSEQSLFISFDYGMIDPSKKTDGVPYQPVKIFVKVGGKVRSVAALYAAKSKMLSFQIGTLVRIFRIQMTHKKFIPASESEENEAWNADGLVEVLEENDSGTKSILKQNVRISMGC